MGDRRDTIGQLTGWLISELDGHAHVCHHEVTVPVAVTASGRGLTQHRVTVAVRPAEVADLMLLRNVRELAIGGGALTIASINPNGPVENRGGMVRREFWIVVREGKR